MKRNQTQLKLTNFQQVVFTKMTKFSILSELAKVSVVFFLTLFRQVRNWNKINVEK